METEQQRYGIVIDEPPSQVVQRWDIPRPLWYLGAVLVVVVLAVGAWVFMASSPALTTAAPPSADQAAPLSKAEAVTTVTEPMATTAPTATASSSATAAPAAVPTGRSASTAVPTTTGATGAAGAPATATPVMSGGGPEPLTARGEAVPDEDVLPAAVPALGAGGGAAGP